MCMGVEFMHKKKKALLHGPSERDSSVFLSIVFVRHLG